MNGLLKTAQGVPPGVATTLLPPQEYTLKVEAMKCLVAILRSMGDWMNKQLRIPDSYTLKSSESEENNREGTPELPNGDSEKPTDGVDSHPEPVSEVSEAAALEQRRAYKLELQVSTFPYMAFHCSYKFCVFLPLFHLNLNNKHIYKILAGRHIAFQSKAQERDRVPHKSR